MHTKLTHPLKVFVGKENNQPMGMLFRYTLPWQIDNIDRDCWRFVDNPQEADVWVFLFYSIGDLEIHWQMAWAKQFYSGQIIILAKLWVIYEQGGTDYYHKRLLEFWSELTDRVVIVDKNLNNRNDVSYDFMLNRNLAYYRDYHRLTRPDLLQWTEQVSARMYQLRPLQKRQNKVFLFTARTVDRAHNYREELRNKLAQVLEPYKDLGYMGTTKDPLPPQEQIPNWRTLMSTQEFSFWWPVHDLYYTTTWISIYVETLTYESDQFCVTEKTWDPLIRGNFILPYGTRHFVKYIKDLGLAMPDNVDYSYDDLSDDDRFERYCESVTQAAQEPIKAYRSQQQLIEHNRNTILSWSYDSLYDKIIAYAETHGWKI